MCSLLLLQVICILCGRCWRRRCERCMYVWPEVVFAYPGVVWLVVLRSVKTVLLQESFERLDYLYKNVLGVHLCWIFHFFLVTCSIKSQTTLNNFHNKFGSKSTKFPQHGTTIISLPFRTFTKIRIPNIYKDDQQRMKLAIKEYTASKE